MEIQLDESHFKCIALLHRKTQMLKNMIYNLFYSDLIFFMILNISVSQGDMT